MQRRNRMSRVTEEYNDMLSSQGEYDEFGYGYDDDDRNGSVGSVIASVFNATKSLILGGSKRHAANRTRRSRYNILRVQPKTLDECWDECIECIQKKKILVFVATEMKRDEAQRAVDSLCGACSCGKGHVEPIGDRVYIFCPPNCSISNIGSLHMSNPSDDKVFHHVL